MGDELLGSVTDKLGGPYLLPLIYAIVRDAMDASNLCGTAEGVYRTLIRAVETLVPDEVAERAREAMQEGGRSFTTSVTPSSTGTAPTSGAEPSRAGRADRRPCAGSFTTCGGVSGSQVKTVLGSEH